MEELKLVLESVEALGRTGAWVFGIYLGVGLLKFVGGFFGSYFIIKAIAAIIRGFIADD